MKANLDELNTQEELDRALSESAQHPVLFFKHSVTCPISSRAFSQLQTFLETADPRVAYKLITVQTAQHLSGSVAQKLGVIHQSPQAILVKDCASVWDASHSAITSDSLDQAIRELLA